MCIAAKLAALEVHEISTKFLPWRAALIAAYRSLSFLGSIVEKDFCVKKSAVLHDTLQVHILNDCVVFSFILYRLWLLYNNDM